MNKFTPGPWHLYASNYLCIESASGNVALCNLARDSKADAQLIAAAPELLAALSELVNAPTIVDSRGYPVPRHNRAMWARARAALAKASEQT